MKILRMGLSLLLGILLLIFATKPALAFCGFYVAKADSSLYNQASQVIIARDGRRTVLTMSNDYQGDVKDFAMVIPVPVVLTEEQVNIADPKIIERLDAFSAPRLVEYFDEDPCNIKERPNFSLAEASFTSSDEQPPTESKPLGVTIEQEFTVGEYDIVILSAKESDGLMKWLSKNGYKLPDGYYGRSSATPYIRQGMKFFVAKVNLEEHSKTGFHKLRPISIAYESPRFMLPILLGMANAQGEQDLIVYLLSPKGQIELTNYRSEKIPSDFEIPEFVQSEFPDFYQAMFEKYHRKEPNVALLEYSWNMGKCDPCVANVLNRDELKQAGVFWLNKASNSQFANRSVFLTRLHLRYFRSSFPEDLLFQETSNKEHFQGRYIVRHPYTGGLDCDAAKKYRTSLAVRQEQEAQTLADLTGWDLEEIYDKIDFVQTIPIPWWRELWDKE